MQTPRLGRGLAIAFVLGGTLACNRTDTDQQARQAAAEVRAAAAQAGERFADSWITTKIQAQYFADDQIKARYIDVTTRDGVATISGYVPSPEARERALQIANATDGVTKVDDRLLIGQSPQAVEASRVPGAVATVGERASAAAATAVAKLDDARVTSSVQARFFLDTMVKGRRIDVDTSAGVVTLRGEVSSEAERAQALLVARTTEGVQRVEDQLTVNAALGRADW